VPNKATPYSSLYSRSQTVSLQIKIKQSIATLIVTHIKPWATLSKYAMFSYSYWLIF